MAEEEARSFLDGAAPPDEGNKLPAHRPGDYNEDLADRIVEAFADGKRNEEIVKLPQFPSRATFFRWKARYPEFAAMLQAAADWRIASLIDSTLQKLDDALADADSNSVDSKNLVDFVKWIAAKRSPAIYGDQPRTVVVPVGPANAPGQPPSYPGDNATLIGQSQVVEGHPLEGPLRTWEQATGRVPKVIAG